jgi:hypothetical protein
MDTRRRDGGSAQWRGSCWASPPRRVRPCGQAALDCLRRRRRLVVTRIAERRTTEDTFAGLRFVRNRMGYDDDPTDLIQPLDPSPVSPSLSSLLDPEVSARASARVAHPWPCWYRRATRRPWPRPSSASWPSRAPPPGWPLPPGRPPSGTPVPPGRRALPVSDRKPAASLNQPRRDAASNMSVCIACAAAGSAAAVWRGKPTWPR